MKDLQRKRRKSSDYQPLSQVLSKVTQDLNLDKKVQDLAVIQCWKELIEPGFAERCQAVKLIRKQGGTCLLVRVDNPMLATQLSFQLEQYTQALNQYASQTGVRLTGIDLQVAALEPR